VIDLVLLNGSQAGACFALPGVPIIIGRSPEAHFRIDDPWISNLHALVEWRGSELWVVDLSSLNGTFVGEQRVTEARVTVGAALAFGRTEALLQPHGEAVGAVDALRTSIRYQPVAVTLRSDRSTAETPGIEGEESDEGGG
jgi:pSer/pThr/pTyr-binding forkhead associated (FHA) protein